MTLDAALIAQNIVAAFHWGPGPHPNGTAQEIHASGSGGAAAKVAKKAAEFEPGVTRVLKNVAAEQGAELVGLEFRLKTTASLERRLKKEAFDFGTTPDQAAHYVTDSLRYTMTFPEHDYAAGVGRVMKALRDMGYTAYDHKFRNAWGEKSYRGINAVLRAPNGARFELQFHTPAGWANKQGTSHALFEKLHRTTNTPDEAQHLVDQIRASWTKVTTPPGADQIHGGLYGW